MKREDLGGVTEGREWNKEPWEQKQRASILNVWARRPSKDWETRIPSERTLLLALYELLVSGDWIRTQTRYDDYPGDTDTDIDIDYFEQCLRFTVVRRASTSTTSTPSIRMYSMSTRIKNNHRILPK